MKADKGVLYSTLSIAACIRAQAPIPRGLKMLLVLLVLLRDYYSYGRVTLGLHRSSGEVGFGIPLELCLALASVFIFVIVQALFLSGNHHRYRSLGHPSPVALVSSCEWYCPMLSPLATKRAVSDGYHRPYKLPIAVKLTPP